MPIDPALSWIHGVDQEVPVASLAQEMGIETTVFQAGTLLTCHDVTRDQAGKPLCLDEAYEFISRNWESHTLAVATFNRLKSVRKTRARSQIRCPPHKQLLPLNVSFTLCNT